MGQSQPRFDTVDPTLDPIVLNAGVRMDFVYVVLGVALWGLMALLTIGLDRIPSTGGRP